MKGTNLFLKKKILSIMIFFVNCSQVQDLLFSRDGDIFFSAGDEISRDTADRNIMAWDFRSTSAISNQIYQVS